jgi:hypothetical protein
MNKEIYIIRGSDKEDYAGFKEKILNLAGEVVQEINPGALKFTITEKEPPRISVIPFRKNKIAVISIMKENPEPIGRLLNTEGFSGSFRVTEALPVSYKKTWEDGKVTPGACLLTLFSSRKNIDYETFIDRWHNSHTPLSLRFHPLWNYVRNVVNEKISENSQLFDGIVEEQVRERADLLNPFRFFGNPLIVIPRMLKVYTDTKSFIDYATMETYLAAEYHVKSFR